MSDEMFQVMTAATQAFAEVLIEEIQEEETAIRAALQRLDELELAGAAPEARLDAALAVMALPLNSRLRDEDERRAMIPEFAASLLRICPSEDVILNRMVEAYLDEPMGSELARAVCEGA